jgi:hypothetical protein
MTEETVQPIIPITTPVRAFENGENDKEFISTVAVFPDGRRMVTGSGDKTLRLWDMKDSVVLKKMEGHRRGVEAVSVSGNGKLIASGDLCGELIAWDGESGESVIQAFEAHSWSIYSLDFSPDGAVLATGSSDKTTKLWNTKTWQPQGDAILCAHRIYCVQYSPSGQHLAIATDFQIQICNPETGEFISKFDGHAVSLPNGLPRNISLAWTPDGTRLLSAGNMDDPTIREWDPSKWKQVGHPWTGHTSIINAIVVNSAGTLVASACGDNNLRLWRLSDRRTIAIFQHSNMVYCAAFSTDGKHILSGGQDKQVFEWEVPNDALGEQPNLPDDQGEIPDQEYDYTQDTDFFRGTNEYRHVSRPQPRQRFAFLKRLRLSVMNTARSSTPPAQPTTLSSASTPITFNARLQRLLPRRHVLRTGPPVVDVAYAKGKERNAAADAPEPDTDLIPEEYFDQEPESQPQSTSVADQANSGEHDRSCFCF